MGASSSGECSSTYYISLRHVHTFLWDPGLMYVVRRGSCVCVCKLSTCVFHTFVLIRIFVSCLTAVHSSV